MEGKVSVAEAARLIDIPSSEKDVSDVSAPRPGGLEAPVARGTPRRGR